jgi:hypothetical protein
MEYIETMSLHDKLAICVQCAELEKQGKHEEAVKLQHTRPLPPFLARLYRDYIGKDELLKSGWNLSEAEANLGPGWIDKKFSR